MYDETIICEFCGNKIEEHLSMEGAKFYHTECRETKGGFKTKKELDKFLQEKIEAEEREQKRRKRARAGTLDSY